eukprot:650004-Pleurochrysis_carterae.AAC.1
MGHVNLAPRVVTDNDPSYWQTPKVVDRVLKLLIHEVMHVIGFTYEKLTEFPCPDAPYFNRHIEGSYTQLRPCAATGSRDP